MLQGWNVDLPAERALAEETTQMVSAISLTGAIGAVAAVAIPVTHMLVYGTFSFFGI